jgi:3-dehydroquinate synthase
MQTLKIKNCSILFNENGYQSLNESIAINKYSSIFILVDEHTNEYCLNTFLPKLETNSTIEIIEIESGEQSKNIECCFEIWSALSELGADRKSLIINLGGGVITDLGGFIASTFKRGIDFIHVPTTLLAMVDAAIGGKNGIDLGNLKNQIGVINLPKMILIDASFLQTLSQREMQSGLAEMLKHGLIYDKNYWNQFKNLESFTTDDLEKLIHRSVEIKVEIVNQDLTENGIRKALNFGHTIGHAIESYLLESKNPLLHGEAIIIGMIIESYLSYKLDLISFEEYSEIKLTFKNIYKPYIFTDKDVDEILKLLIHDKKNEYGKVQYALLDGIGKCKINQASDNKTIIDAFNDYKQL